MALKKASLACTVCGSRNYSIKLKNFISVIEYTAFFVVLIYLFDQVVAKGILKLIDMF